MPSIKYVENAFLLLGKKNSSRIVVVYTAVRLSCSVNGKVLRIARCVVVCI